MLVIEVWYKNRDDMERIRNYMKSLGCKDIYLDGSFGSQCIETLVNASEIDDIRNKILSKFSNELDKTHGPGVVIRTT